MSSAVLALAAPKDGRSSDDDNDSITGNETRTSFTSATSPATVVCFGSPDDNDHGGRGDDDCTTIPVSR